MAININNLGNSPQVNKKAEQQTQVRQQATDSSVKAESAKAAQQDSVSLTPQAKQINDLQKKASDASVVDQKRIDRLKQAIASGEYRVDPEKLARSILNFELKLP